MSILDFKKQRELYQPSAKEVAVVDVPAMRFIMLDGHGDPNGPGFEERVEALYALSFGLKMLPKKGVTPPGYQEYTVAPLEGLWWVAQGCFDFAKRDNWRYTLMIRQPDFVIPELFASIQQETARKKKNPQVLEARLEDFPEGLSLQIMHIGPYSEEPATLAKIYAFAEEQGYTLHGKHHEIYLGDPRRADPAKLKTVLRQPILAKSN